MAPPGQPGFLLSLPEPGHDSVTAPALAHLPRQGLASFLSEFRLDSAGLWPGDLSPCAAHSSDVLLAFDEFGFKAGDDSQSFLYLAHQS